MLGADPALIVYRSRISAVTSMHVGLCMPISCCISVFVSCCSFMTSY
jgi:hypothetical protein